ncbi:unnamed protein product, partial [marine sediment metagenome]
MNPNRIKSRYLLNLYSVLIFLIKIRNPESPGCGHVKMADVDVEDYDTPEELLEALR